MGYPPSFHWLGSRPRPDYTLTCTFFPPSPLPQLVSDPLACSRPTTHRLDCSSNSSCAYQAFARRLVRPSSYTPHQPPHLRHPRQVPFVPFKALVVPLDFPVYKRIPLGHKKCPLLSPACRPRKHQPLQERLLQGHESCNGGSLEDPYSLGHPTFHMDSQTAILGETLPRVPTLPDATISTPINDALLNHFFPPQPSRPLPSILHPFADWTALTGNEISAALDKCSPFSGPVPATIPYTLWKSLDRIAPDIIISLLGLFLLFSHYPFLMKMANGVVRDKLGKPSYDWPSSFRIIVLLQTMSKILERIVASRLSSINRYVGLLYHNQCGSLP